MHLYYIGPMAISGAQSILFHVLAFMIACIIWLYEEGMYIRGSVQPSRLGKTTSGTLWKVELKQGYGHSFEQEHDRTERFGMSLKGDVML